MARSHPLGGTSIPLRPVFVTWLGWLFDRGRPIVFALDTTTDRRELVRQCLTFGHEHLVGEIAGGPTAWTTAGLPVATIPLVPPTDVAATVLDVREGPEWSAGHLPGAVHVELGDLPSADLPEGPMTVMGGHGERAMTGATLLEADGRRVLSVLDGGPHDWQAVTGGELEQG